VPFVTSTLSSVYLWARLGTVEPPTGQGRWLTALSIWAGLALLSSALWAWSAQAPRQLIERTTLYGAAYSLLAAGLGLPAQWLALVGASVVMSVCALYVGWTQSQYLDLADSHSSWRVAPAGIALLSLAGLPLTLGFPARVAVYARAFADGRWLVLFLVLVGEAGLLGALLRVLFDVEVVPDADTGSGSETTWRTWRKNLAYGGAAALALGIVVVGTLPGHLGAPGLPFWLGLPRLHIWAALLLPPVGAIALYRSRGALTAWLDEWWPLIQRLSDLRWAVRAVERGAHLAGMVVWGGSRVVEGAGYMAWVLLCCLIVFLFLRPG
jgi:formate hydrogenlyase subunit 3/multisubunit Na+/H+ antiporter MnhD subunit